jgi:hypothetical protein
VTARSEKAGLKGNFPSQTAFHTGFLRPPALRYMPTLIDVLVQTAASAGCAEPTRLRHSLEIAADKRQPLMDALVDANMVDEDRFFEKLATGLGIPFDENGAADAPEGIHNRFPAKIALRHRVFPTQLSNTEATLITYNPFDLSARQAVGQELRKRVHWQIAPRHRILEALHQGYGVGAENFEELLEGREADIAAALRAEQNSPGNQFTQAFQSLVYAQLAKNLSDQLFGENPQNNGSMTFSNVTIAWARSGSEVSMTIEDRATNSTTTITVPVGAFTF